MLLTLDASLHKPLYVQIRDQLRERILMGVLKPGDRLDPSRELAKTLGVHRTTVGNAYADLEAEGLIQGTVGRGTFVSSLAATLRAPAARTSGRKSNDLFWNSVLAPEPQDNSLGRLLASSLEPGVISFAAPRCPEALSPVDLVRRATDAALHREGARLLHYGPSDGYPPLKRFLQGQLRRDGVETELDEILITNGCQQALDLLRRSLTEPGDAVACENPTYYGLWQAYDASGIRLIGIPVGPEGMDLEYLRAVLEQNKLKLILTSPSFQNPTGRTMPLPARKQLLEIAARHQVPVVEDDIYSALRYTGRALPPLKALDTSGLVIYLNSFSKVGFPGLRVGWIVAARRVIEHLRLAKQRADMHTNQLGQAVMEEFGRRGWLEKLVRRIRREYAHKLEVLRRAAKSYFPPEVRCHFPEGGMSVWVEMPAGLDSLELLARARDQRVIFAPSPYFYFQNPQHNAFRLSYTALPDELIEKGIRILGELLTGELRKVSKTRKRAPDGARVALV